MTVRILLDSGVVGLLCLSPLIPEADECKTWADDHAARGTLVLIPDVIDYEVRRELVRVGATAKLVRLEQIRERYDVVGVSEDDWKVAADFWAIVRQTGRTTADPKALDGDAILAAVASTVGDPGDVTTIATYNVKHLTRFPGIDAREWRSII